MRSIVVGQSCDDLPQCEKRLIDLDSFFELLGVLDLINRGRMRLSFATSQVNELQFADDVCLSITSGQVFLLHDEGQDTVRPTRRLIHVVGRDDFVLETFPEVLESIFDCGTLEDVNIFNQNFICHGIHFQSESIHLIFLKQRLLRICVQQIVHLLVVELNVLHLDADPILPLSLFSLPFNLLEKLPDGSWDDTFLL